ncbi:MAG: hypothetical protein V4577_27175 [Bacteroidota bacterium]
MKYSLFLYSLILFSCCANAQNIIYQKGNKKITGQVVDIDDDKIKYITGPSRTSSPRTRLKISDLILVFNSYGDYLVFNNGAMFSKNEGTEFMNEAGILRSNDIIVNKKGEIFTAKILSEKVDSISYGHGGQLVNDASSAIVAIIYKNGNHKLFVKPEDVILYLTEDKKPVIASLLKKPEEPAVKAIASVASEASPVTATPKPTLAVPNKSTVPSQSETTAPVTRPDFNAESFKRKSLVKIRDFEKDLQIIMSPETSIAKSNLTIKLANELFLSDAKIQVSSLNRPTMKPVAILTYLNSLQTNAGKYSEVKIEFAEINYTTNFSQNVDGSWSAVVTVAQKYSAIKDGVVIYSDVTNKNIVITVKKYKKTEENGYTEGWEVYLGNISVLQTDRLK